MKDTLLKMLKEKAYRKGEFTLSSGKTSEHYVNCKPVTLNGEGLYITSNLILDQIKPDVVAVGGLALGADPLVSGVAMSCYQQWRPLDALIVRKKAKGHGTQQWIEGPTLTEGSKVTVLEDVVTTGESSVQAVFRLRDAGYIVDRVVSIIDRQEDTAATKAMDSAEVELISLFTLEDLV